MCLDANLLCVRQTIASAAGMRVTGVFLDAVSVLAGGVSQYLFQNGAVTALGLALNFHRAETTPSATGAWAVSGDDYESYAVFEITALVGGYPATNPVFGVDLSTASKSKALGSTVTGTYRLHVQVVVQYEKVNRR